MIHIYNGSGDHIATRYGYLMADILGPGETTVLTETMPSIVYMSGESNFYPDGWASWDLLGFNSTPASPGSTDLVVIGSRVSSVTRDSTGKVTALGLAVNTLDHSIKSVEFWVTLYDAKGRLINAATASDWISEGVAPGAEVPFEVTMWEYTCFGSAGWGAAGGFSG